MKAVHIAVPRIPAWVGVVALGAALILTVGASVLPERWQALVLYLGVGLAFASVGGILFTVLTSARPHLQGPSAVAGIIVGVMPLLVVWHAARPGREVPQGNPPEARQNPVRPGALKRVQGAPVQAVAQTQARDTELARELAEISDLIEHKARAALQKQDGALLSITLGRGRAPNVKTRMAAAARDLEEVQAALSAIRTNKARSHGELLAVIGDTTPLDGLITALRNFGTSLDNASDGDTLNQLAEEPRSAALPVGQWIADCGQRIAELRKGLTDAS